MTLEIIIGKNKTGKTKYLNEIYDNKNQNNVLYIPAEIDFQDIIKDPKYIGGKNPSYFPHKKILDFLKNKIIEKKRDIFSKKLNEDEFNFLTEWKKIIDDFKNNFKKIIDEDNFLENQFNEYINMKKIENEILFDYDLFEHINIKNIEGSSGSINYSLLRLIFEIVDNEKLINNNWTLVIDEIEKFSHPELIFKLSEIIILISKKINVVVTTHSPIFIEKIFNIHKRYIKKDIELNIIYKIKKDIKETPEDIFSIDIKKIKKIIEIENYRVLSNISKILFSSNIFLIEGLLENTLINDIIFDDEKLSEKYFTIIDCEGKNNIKKYYNIIKDLNLINFCKVCIIYDYDNNNEIKIDKELKDKKIFPIINIPDIEQKFFNLTEDKQNIELKDNITIERSSFKKEKDFIFSIEWIEKNSTKNNVHEEIEDFKNKIINFICQ